MKLEKPLRVLLAEEGVRDRSGHWTVYNETIASGLRSRNCAVTIAAHRGADAALVGAGTVQPVFRESRWGQEFDSLSPLKRKVWTLRHNLRLAGDLTAFLSHVPPFDICFAGNVNLAHIAGWHRLVRRQPEAIKKLVLMFVQDAGHYSDGNDTPHFPRQAALLRWSVQLLRPMIRQGRVYLAAETEVTRKQYEQLAGLPVHLLPHPVNLPKLYEQVTETPLLVAPGFARYEKGSDILQAAWAIYRKRNPGSNVRLLIQWNRDFSLPDGMQERKRHSETDGVTYMHDSLDEQQLAAILHRASGVIMPYRRTSYYSRLSRVAIEAMQAGAPILHTADTWLDVAVAQAGAGIAVSGESPESWAAGIERFVNSLKLLKNKASERSKTARTLYSAEEFADRLISICGFQR